MFFEIGALENVAIFTEKHLCWSLFLIKLQAEKHFRVNIANFLGIAFLENTCGCFLKFVPMPMTH